MINKVLRYALLTLGAVAMVGPFLWMLATSLKGNHQMTDVDAPLWPAPLTVRPYQTLIGALPFWRFFVNSLLVTVLSTVFQLFTSATAAYAFSRLRFRGQNVVFGLYLLTMMIPLQVIIVPLYIEMRYLNLVDSYAGLILPTVVSSFGVFMLRQGFLTLPRELDEAAFVDGAGHVTIFTRVLLPLMGPSLATFAVFAFMSTWNAFLWPLVVAQSTAHRTLPVGLSLLTGQYATSWNVVMAGSVVSVLPILALYVFAQRHVVRGVAFTGLKG